MTPTPPPPAPSAPRPSAADALRAGVQREDGARPAGEASLQARIDAAMATMIVADTGADPAAQPGTEGITFVPDATDRRLLKLLRKELTQGERKVDTHALLRAGLRVIASLDRATLAVVLDNLTAPPTKTGKDKKKARDKSKARDKEKEKSKGNRKEKDKGKGHA